MIGPLAKLEERGELRKGITYYVGGAGPIGNVGSWDIPQGLAEAGYEGFVEVFTWQGMTHAGDQINLSRNRGKAAELATEIRKYRRRYPSRKINIIALSAGTGIATFALEYLPEGVEVEQVVFLGCSLSSTYNLTRALRRVHGGIYCIYSPRDPILKNVVWYTGTVDRSSAEDGIAGMEGFRIPSPKGSDTVRQYKKVYNVCHRDDFNAFGYTGLHTDSTSRGFLRAFIAPLLQGDDEKLLGDASLRRPKAAMQATSRPTMKLDELDMESFPHEAYRKKQ